MKNIVKIFWRRVIGLISSVCYPVNPRWAILKSTRLFALLPLFLLLSCASSQIEPRTATKTCFQNVFGHDDLIDIEVLSLTVSGQTVVGEYHWLPAAKDRRIGYFSGTQTGPVILAKYDFTQEGQKFSSEIQLIVSAHKISISGGEPEVGLTSEIQRVDCAQLKPVHRDGSSG